ncbi:hypothetical protein ACIQVR_42140 [Streptomyces xanthochromogenes]|uniref:hypothetical protein n=1 Tax=Streptomyces xanthochromogenes TaxID=67384 RepID=UPI00381D473B
MTTDNHPIQDFARQQLGHIPVESSELYICTDSTAAFDYVANDTIAVVDTARPDDEGGETR